MSLDDILRLQDQEGESWQERLKAIARGTSYGFVAEIVAEDVSGYGVLPEREFKMMIHEQAHALFNAVKHRLVLAADAAGDAGWADRITARRTDALVRVYRVVDEGREPVPLPEVYAEKILSTPVRVPRR